MHSFLCKIFQRMLLSLFASLFVRFFFYFANFCKVYITPSVCLFLSLFVTLENFCKVYYSVYLLVCKYVYLFVCLQDNSKTTALIQMWA